MPSIMMTATTMTTIQRNLNLKESALKENNDLAFVVIVQRIDPHKRKDTRKTVRSGY